MKCNELDDRIKALLHHDEIVCAVANGSEVGAATERDTLVTMVVELSKALRAVIAEAVRRAEREAPPIVVSREELDALQKAAEGS